MAISLWRIFCCSRLAHLMVTPAQSLSVTVPTSLLSPSKLRGHRQAVVSIRGRSFVVFSPLSFSAAGVARQPHEPTAPPLNARDFFRDLLLRSHAQSSLILHRLREALCELRAPLRALVVLTPLASYSFPFRSDQLETGEPPIFSSFLPSAPFRQGGGWPRSGTADLPAELPSGQSDQ
jgi:hypothetical protein